MVVLTKADLIRDVETPMAEVLAAAPEVPVHAVSSRTGQGLEALAPYLQPGQTVVFLGMSGVGKSSLLNRLMQKDVMEVKEIREDDSRGRHTTTHRQLFMLPGGAMVIDTPGMRELGLFDVDDGIATASPRCGGAVQPVPLLRLQAQNRARMRRAGRPAERFPVAGALGQLSGSAAREPAT